MPIPAALSALAQSIRSEGARRHARWDDAAFARFGPRWIGQLWRTLEPQGEQVQARSAGAYLTLVAAGIGAGYLSDNAGLPRTLLEGLVLRAPWWLAATEPASHGRIIASLWNLADGARREALWMEQYLLARLGEIHDPLELPERVLELLRPALEAQPDARWQGPYGVQVINLADSLPAFLPGRISMLTPSLVRIADRRHDAAVGVLLAPVQGQAGQQGGAVPAAVSEATCIGRMQGGEAGAPVRTAAVHVSWGRDHVQVGDTRVPLPLMACEPLHTLALASGHLLAVVATSQRLWLVQSA
jgi:hypothetical protein